MTTPSSSPASKLLARYPDDVQALALEAIRLIRRLLPEVDENADATAGLIAFGYGPGYKGMVCTLILSKSGVKIGLVRGSELDDPRGLLEGSGKVHRYIQMKSAADLRRPGVSALVKATYAAWRERTSG
ncbi:MAG TPA: DUF1801 domain-containing protein [Vicinamibacterales bacterium]|jgi:hypothetical protein|nr:DUF1801 domain-containing protein [Vicinamibacterales bacterium]